MPYGSDAQRRAVWASKRRKEHKLDERWNKTLVDAPGKKLTRLEIFNYYADPKIRQKLLENIKDRPVLAVQTVLPADHVMRRHRAPGEPIRVSQAERDPHHKNDLAWYTERRFTEFHPVIGKSTKEIWVDIDPGETVHEKDLKETTRLVDHMVKNMPGVEKTDVAYSGGRGYYVRGLLAKETDTTEARKALQKGLDVMRGKDKIFMGGEVTFNTPKKNQIRLDLSTLHDKGSIRAPYSLNATTGLVSVPVKVTDLHKFDPQKDADPKRLVQGNYWPKRASAEFAPGIPSAKKTHPLPELKGGDWTMSVQEHKARRAGKHWDLRLVDHSTGFAHSWAIPKSRLPEGKERPLLAMRTPTHTSEYSLTFGKDGPRQIEKGYGAGTVSIVKQGPVKILSSSPSKIKFETKENKPERFILFHTSNNSWMMRNISHQIGDPMAKTAYETGYSSVLQKLGVAESPGAMQGGVQKTPSTSENLEPLDEQDENLPAGQLARALSQLEIPGGRDDSDRNRNLADDRMNKPTNWSTPVSVPYSYGSGPAPIISGST